MGEDGDVEEEVIRDTIGGLVGLDFAVDGDAELASMGAASKQSRVPA
jgi:hypothetical protein